MADAPDVSDNPIPLRDAAERYDATYARLQKAAYDGRLVIDHRIGRQTFVRPSEVQRFLREHGRAPSPQPAAPIREGAPMGHIIAVAILKGGTAKTTTTLNLGASFAERGLRVLLIDSDHQCSLSRTVGIEPTDLEPEQTLYGAMQAWMAKRELRLDRAIHSTTAGVDLVAASVRLSRTNNELQLIPRREYVLQQLLAPIAPQYDVVLIDTMPTNNNLVFNALVAAESVLLPMEPEKLAVESLQLTLEDIAQARESGLNPHLEILGVLLTRVKKGRTLHREYSDQIRQIFGEELPVFDTIIYDSIRFPESQDRNKTVLQYEPDGVSAEAYRQLAEEILRGWE